ncbi:drug/metabolite transporter, DME family [Actinokineospora alba]|uniref:Drug/metabolite transporter, DME family n=1 Tax=Actinokineospora alba TaxID=504798 RepID=A0A1H0Q0Y5_9PSEU|nr:EamA family transporter [Actinokineospora alba]TDP66025.1 DME family drug/metabolite transporter [Actinokineospora alba]SDI59696.1 drug/metabolite transporter, DME family [Actinokineospora alba]SDP11023.1 drug/metabolite transporter, DME family [Actinokineospora alba]
MSRTTLPTWQGLSLVVTAAIAWGTGGAAAAVLYRTTDLGPVAVTFWRFLCGTLLLASALGARKLITGQPVVAGPRSVATGVCLAVSQSAYFAAVGVSGVAVATAVTLGATPALTALGSRSWLSRRGSLGAISGLVGLVFLCGPAGSSPTGLALALLSAVGFAAATILGRGSLGETLAALAVGTVLLAPFAVVPVVTPETLGLIGFLGAVPTALAYALFFSGLKTVHATTASVITLVEPLTATVIAVGWLGEVLTVSTGIGMALLLVAVVVASG